MRNLADSVFGRITISQDLVDEYYERNRRKAEDEKWLKTNKPVILNAMKELGKEKSDFGSIRVSVSTPDESKFDYSKLVEFLISKGFKDIAVTYEPIVDEAVLTELIGFGEIDLEELKAAAWVEKSGTPRLMVKQL